MPVSYSWLPDYEGIMLFEIDGDWTWDDFYQASAEYNAMIETVEERVDFIMDFSNASSRVPASGFANIASLTKRGERTLQWKLSVMVMPNVLYRTVMQTFSRLYPKLGERFRIVKSIDEALNVITQSRSE